MTFQIHKKNTITVNKNQQSKPEPTTSQTSSQKVFERQPITTQTSNVQNVEAPTQIPETVPQSQPLPTQTSSAQNLEASSLGQLNLTSLPFPPEIHGVQPITFNASTENKKQEV